MKFSFKRLFIPAAAKTELLAYQSWEVRWHSTYGIEYNTGGFHLKAHERVEIFPTENDARVFAKQVREAHKLIGNEGDHIKIIVKENKTKLAQL